MEEEKKEENKEDEGPGGCMICLNHTWNGIKVS